MSVHLPLARYNQVASLLGVSLFWQPAAFYGVLTVTTYGVFVLLSRGLLKLSLSTLLKIITEMKKLLQENTIPRTRVVGKGANIVNHLAAT